MLLGGHFDLDLGILLIRGFPASFDFVVLDGPILTQDHEVGRIKRVVRES
jgi:hypothetical protein